MAVLVVTAVGALAWAELRFSLVAEEGLSVMGGPLRPDLAQADAVTRASIDAISSASRVSHGGGIHGELRGDRGGSLSLGMEYARYQFELDYEHGRAMMSVLSFRALAMARLSLLRLSGRPTVTFGFGGYLEVPVYDEGKLAGSWTNIEVLGAAIGIAVDLRIHPYAFTLPNGDLVPGLYIRAYRGLTPLFRDEMGSNAPLASISAGLLLRYELGSNGNGRSGM